MSRPLFALLLLPLAAGAAAGSFGSLEEFARATGMKQGGWHTRLKIESANVEVLPGADPAKAAEIKARTESQVGRVNEVDECFDPASAASPVLPGFVIESQCSFSRLEAGDGRWAMDATCPNPERRGTAKIVAQGTYSPETVTGRHEVHLSASGVIVHAKIETVSRFTGECRPPAVAQPGPGAD
jgi:hypothetical protein